MASVRLIGRFDRLRRWLLAEERLLGPSVPPAAAMGRYATAKRLRNNNRLML